jgi:hypothetical protein
MAPLLAATAWCAVAASVIAPRTASAKIHNCENTSLLTEDTERLARVAKRVLPPHQEMRLAERCRWADSAFAWVTTPTVTAENGVSQWWMASCSRDARNWSCEPAVLHREIDQAIEVHGGSRRIKLGFDAGTSLETAERVASEALKIYLEPSPTVPPCGEAGRPQTGWEDIRAHRPLPLPTEQIHITVSRESSQIWVWFGGLMRPGELQLGIDFTAGDAQLADRCWGVRGP